MTLQGGVHKTKHSLLKKTKMLISLHKEEMLFCEPVGTASATSSYKEISDKQLSLQHEDSIFGKPSRDN